MMRAQSQRGVPFHQTRRLSLGLVLLSLFFSRMSLTSAATYTGKTTEDVDREDKPIAGEQTETTQTTTPTAKSLTREEILQAMKHRAERELARRRASKWSFHTYATWTGGVDSNPRLTKDQDANLYTEEYLSYTLGYRLLTPLTWQTSYSLDAINYNGFTDLNTLTNSLSTKLIYQVVKPLRLEAGYTFDDLAYPNDRAASYWGQKVNVRLRHTFFKNYYHYVGWTYLYKQYEDKLIRNGAGTRIPSKRRKDHRHTGTYEIGGRFGENLTLRLKQDVYFNDANDHFQDFYDSQDYKIRLSGSYDWTPKWSTSGGFAYELKRYEERVNTAKRPVKQRDYTKSYDVGLAYKLDQNLKLSYNWHYARNTSNEASQRYGDVTNSLTLTASF